MKPLQILAEKYVQMHQESASSPVIDANGDKYWRNANGQFHRTDGPAIEWDSGSKAWYVNGELHRLDGPAVINAKGGKEWYIDDIQYTEKGFNRYLKALKDRLDILNKDNPGIEMDI